MDEIKIIDATEDVSPMGVPEAQSTIEAILFAAGHPIKYSKLAEIIGYSERDTKALIKNYADIYNDSPYPRGVILALYDDTCQLCTSEQYKKEIKTALGIKENGSLSQTSLEVLAVIAYNQPVTKAYIEQVRGVDCTYPINALCDKGLIERSGKLDVPGRPNLYSTTDDFLRCFGLASLDELPEISILEDNTKASEE